jgi:hypothetical protein
VLAQARILYGIPDQADPLLAPLLPASPADPEILYLHGLRHLIVGRTDPAKSVVEFREARKWFLRVY